MNTFVVATIKLAALLLLAGGILWQVAGHSGLSPLEQGTAYVHVTANDVDVAVDNLEYHVSSVSDGPIVCELGPGKHMLRMSRDGEMLYEEEFWIGAGKEVILTAWERLSVEPIEAQSSDDLSLTSGLEQPDSAHR